MRARANFKGLAEETGLPYQKLIDLYRLYCAKKRKRLAMKWARSSVEDKPRWRQ
jgi:hypothetical protein